MKKKDPPSAKKADKELPGVNARTVLEGTRRVLFMNALFLISFLILNFFNPGLIQKLFPGADKILDSLAITGAKHSQVVQTNIVNSDPVKMVWLRKNGEYATSDGEQLESQSDAGDDKYYVSISKSEFDKRMNNSKERFFTPEGIQISNFDEIKQKSILHVVPGRKNAHFIWPPYKIGQRIPIHNPKSPIQNKTIELEVLNQEPKVFLIRNFLSESEMSALIARATDPSNPYTIRESTVGTESWVSNQGKAKKTSHRTSQNAYDVDSITSVLVNRRIFELLRIPWDIQLAVGLYYPLFL